MQCQTGRLRKTKLIHGEAVEMVTKEDIERYYAEKTGKNYDNDPYAVPLYIVQYFNRCGLDSDKKGLYWAYTEYFKDALKEYPTMEQVIDDIRQKLEVDIEILQKLKNC